ncbi:MAG: hypothetical protein IPK52_22265 [Chloroflexi bacterium]|nr:hypothetical protein [Chloroflexota bacterium]
MVVLAEQLQQRTHAACGDAHVVDKLRVVAEAHAIFQGQQPDRIGQDDLASGG